MRPPAALAAQASSARDRAAPLRTVLTLLTPALTATVVSWLVFRQGGMIGLLLLIVMLIAGISFTLVSFRHMVVPVIFWLIALLGFRNIFMLFTAGLPDISPDRVLLVWIFSLLALKIALGVKPRARWHVLDTLLLLHLCYLLASILIHEKTGLNSWTRSYLMGYAAYFVGKYVIDGNVKLMRIIFGFLLVMNLYYGITSVAEHLHLHSLVWPKLILDPSNRPWANRSHGVFLQPALFGTVMALLLPFQIYFLRSARNPLVRLVLYASLPLVAAGIFFTYTRGNWLAGGAALLAIGLVGWRRYLPLVSRFVIVGVLLLATGLIDLQADRFFVQRMSAENTITGRLGTLGRAFRVFLDNPVFGVGYWRYREVKDQYAGTIEVPIYGVIKRSHDIEASIHDIYIGTLCEEGLVGASLQFAIYLQVFLIFRRKYRLRQRGDPFATGMMPIMAGVMAAYFAGGLSFDYRFFTSLLALFYLMAGMIAGYEPAEDEAPERTPEPPLELVERPVSPLTR